MPIRHSRGKGERENCREASPWLPFNVRFLSNTRDIYSYIFLACLLIPLANNHFSVLLSQRWPKIKITSNKQADKLVLPDLFLFKTTERKRKWCFLMEGREGIADLKFICFNRERPFVYKLQAFPRSKPNQNHMFKSLCASSVDSLPGSVPTNFLHRRKKHCRIAGTWDVHNFKCVLKYCI